MISPICRMCFSPAVYDLGEGAIVCAHCMTEALSRADIASANARGVPAMPITAFARFIAMVGDVNVNGCRLWKGKCRGFGYGSISLFNEDVNSHRAAWRILVGPLTNEQHVLHKCDIPACVNIDHLFLGTHLENVADMDRKGRRRGQTRDGKIPKKLNDDRVALILARYVGGEGAAALAKEFGVDLSTIGALLHGRTWRHVARPAGFSIHKKTSALRIEVAPFARTQI
jgi:hypothetical protein